jgi:citrate lyase beta subunit
MGLTLGIEDFARALGLPLKREGEALDLQYPRAHLALVAASLGLQAVDGIWPRLDDVEGMARFAVQGRRLGMTGMSLLHPAQIPPCHDAYGPSPDDIAYAEEVLKAYAEAEASGQSAVSLRGQFLDPPIVDRARRTVALAAR